MTPKEEDTLVTETINRKTINIHEMKTDEIVTLINNEDKKVAYAVEKELPQIIKAIECVVTSLESGGRLFYIGAGTSGRIGVLDASECPPTYNTPEGLVVGIIAGGDVALRKAIEGAEDNISQGKDDLLKHNFNDKDVLIGIAASGTTPYVTGALQYANDIGAQTIGVSCNPNTTISSHSQIPIEVVVGPEVIMGSTRMKSATAQKMVLNMITTTSMILLGKVYQNLMVDLQASNVKLRKRAINIVKMVTSCEDQEAKDILEKTNWKVKDAIVIRETGVSIDIAQKLLKDSNGRISEAINLAKYVQ
ncbi:MAG: N-acetylmuramic acid 6-phosphate etherase [Bacillus sp. (in: Bacteria)]|nr:N-acetylmuramic acid 6-phosphate etherase [Bacillus sp. (in: firmicutes)]